MSYGWADKCSIFRYLCMQNEIATEIATNPVFYKRYVDDTYVRRKKYETEKLFIDLNL